MKLRCDSFHALLLAILLAVGFELVWAFSLNLVVGMVKGLFPERSTKPRNEEFLKVRTDGVPIIANFKQPLDGIYRTLDGKPTEFGSMLDDMNGVVRWNSLKAEIPWTGNLSAFDWSKRLTQLRGAHENRDVVWYFVHDGQLDGHGYFVGYDTNTKHRIGYIGRNGGLPEEPLLAEQFPVDGRKLLQYRAFLAPDFKTHGNQSDDLRRLWTVYLLSDDGVVEVDVKDQTVKMLWKGADLVSACMTLKTPTEQILKKTLPSFNAILVRQSKSLVLLDFEGNELETFMLPTEFLDFDLECYRLSGDELLVRKKNKRDELFWVDKAGKIVRHEQVSLRYEPGDFYQPWPNTVASYALQMFILPSPAAVAGIMVWDPGKTWNWPERSNANPHWEVLKRILREFWLFFTVNFTLSFLLAVLCCIRQRKFGLSGTWMWVGFVLLFGAPGYLGYRFHCVWPARLPCPSCGRRAPRDRDACIVCGREFPSPAMKGIEVFA